MTPIFLKDLSKCFYFGKIKQELFNCTRKICKTYQTIPFVRVFDQRKRHSEKNLSKHIRYVLKKYFVFRNKKYFSSI